MRKVLLFLFCLLLAVTALVSCQNEIGGYLDQYDIPSETEPEVTVHIYIPCDAATTENAISTVSGRIANEGKERYDSTFVMHYFKASEYQQKALEAVRTNKAAAQDMSEQLVAKNRAIAQKKEEISAESNAAKRAELKEELVRLQEQPIHFSVDVVLVNSLEMMNELQESGTLADLTSFINSNTFGRLKTQITTALLNAAMTDGKFFAIPNNHVITTGFTLMKIKKATARDTYGFSPAELLALRSEHEARELIGDEHYDECVEILTDCRYEDIAFYEAQGCYVNVIATPVVDAEEAFLAAFAVANAVDDLKTGAESVSIHRAMQFIYALNTDVKLHNLLQFGFDSANYIRSVDPQTGAVTVTREGVPENDTYVIDLFYAGDQFLSYYIGDWNETAAKNGGLHNASTDHPIVPPVPEEPVQDPVVDGE